MMDVVIIGGGASGMATAIRASLNGAKVTIIEKNNKLGKKLLVTGNGRCNFWNKEQDLNKYHSQNIEIFKEIYDLKKDEVLKFFDDLGIVYQEINGYYYPVSNQAITIVEALMRKIEKLGIRIIYNEEVLKIKKDNNKFVILTDKNKYEALKVVIATGSIASINDEYLGYQISQELGHNITNLYPSLVQVKGKDSYYNKWNGVRAKAKLSLIVDNNIIKEEMGEVQFTDYGLSGICLFNLSGLINDYLNNNKEVLININLVPWFNNSKDEFKKYLTNLSNKLDYTLKDILEGFLNYKLVRVILDLNNIKDDIKWNDVKQDKVIDYLMNFLFRVLETKDFRDAQVVRGGIFLNEVNSKTLESKKVDNLYFTGEILDVDGICGGYNLGFAWMSALLVGDSIND